MTNTHYNDLPRLQLISTLPNITMLSSSDVERNVLNHVDFNYYSISSFKSGVGNKQLTSVPDSFSVLHSNVRSLSANYDKSSLIAPI